MKYTADFTTIPTEVAEKLTAKVRGLNCEPVLICRSTNYPEDVDKFFLIVGKYTNPSPYFDGHYAAWTASCLDGRASLTQGYYHISFASAMALVAEKIRDCNKEV